MITGLAHIAIAVTDLDQAISAWMQATGGTLAHREVVPAQGVEVACIAVGELRIELMQPTSELSPVAKSLARRGPGLHHIALAATSTQSELDRLKALGLRLIDDTARPGAEGTQVGFLHPSALDGVLVELVERPSE